MTLDEIRQVVSQAHVQAAAIAQNRSDDDVRILAIAIAETARAVEALSRFK